MSKDKSSKKFGIDAVLKELKIATHNNGASTGIKHLITKGKELKSYSPVDGKLLSTIRTAEAKD